MLLIYKAGIVTYRLQRIMAEIISNADYMASACPACVDSSSIPPTLSFGEIWRLAITSKVLLADVLQITREFGCPPPPPEIIILLVYKYLFFVYLFVLVPRWFNVHQC